LESNTPLVLSSFASFVAIMTALVSTPYTAKAFPVRRHFGCPRDLNHALSKT
jgi:hypothetical protein